MVLGCQRAWRRRRALGPSRLNSAGQREGAPANRRGATDAPRRGPADGVPRTRANQKSVVCRAGPRLCLAPRASVSARVPETPAGDEAQQSCVAWKAIVRDPHGSLALAGECASARCARRDNLTPSRCMGCASLGRCPSRYRFRHRISGLTCPEWCCGGAERHDKLRASSSSSSASGLPLSVLCFRKSAPFLGPGAWSRSADKKRESGLVNSWPAAISGWLERGGGCARSPVSKPSRPYVPEAECTSSAQDLSAS
jgi:hypothetical protein